MPTPDLGYGTRGEVKIDTVNQWMRTQPWYQTLIQSFGQNPNNVHLNDSQKQQVIKAAQANGVVVDEGHNGQEVDDSGNFQAKSHALRNTLIVAGIAAASLATMGAAGVFAGGAAGAGAGAGAGAAGAGTLASTAVGTGLAAPIAGGAGLAAGGGAAAGAGTLGSLAGVGHFLGTAGGAQLASTAGGVFANIYGANKQADASKYGVDAQTAAEKYAADLQDAAAQRTEAFTRQQAESGWQSNEHTQKSNYDQWAARQNAIMGSLGNQLGINYTPPAYAAGVDPNFTGSAPSATSPSSTGAAPNVDPSKGDVGGQVSAFFKSRGVSDHETPYWVEKWPELVARGKELNDPNYANSRLAASEVFGGTPAAPPAASTKGTLASFVNPTFMQLPGTTPTPTPYQPGTLGAYFGRA